MDEQNIKQITDAIVEEEVIEFEKAIVNIPSFTTEETEVATYIHDYMSGFGGNLEVELQEVPLEGGTVSHNVIARLPGSGGGKTLLFFGHLDTGPIRGRAYAQEEFKTWKRDPFDSSVEDGWLYGKGSQDEKGGITAWVLAAKALVDSGIQLKGDVIFVGVQGHKRVSSGTLYMLEQGVKADYVINSENTGNMVIHAFVGRSEGRIHIRAKELHFHTKDTHTHFRGQLTAAEVLREVWNELGPEMEAPGEDTWMTFEKSPYLPTYPQYRNEGIEFHRLNHVSLEFQIRTAPGMTDETIRADLERLLKKYEEKYPHIQTEVEWPSRGRTRPAVSNPKDHPVVLSLAQWHEHINGEVGEVGVLGRSGAAADASHTHAAGMDSILYGPGGGNTDNEYRLKGELKQGPTDERVAVKDLVNTARVFALTAADVCGVSD